MWNREAVIGKQKDCGFSQKWKVYKVLKEKGKKNIVFFLAEIESEIRLSTKNASQM